MQKKVRKKCKKSTTKKSTHTKQLHDEKSLPYHLLRTFSYLLERRKF